MRRALAVGFHYPDILRCIHPQTFLSGTVVSSGVAHCVPNEAHHEDATSSFRDVSEAATAYVVV